MRLAFLVIMVLSTVGGLTGFSEAAATFPNELIVQMVSAEGDVRYSLTISKAPPVK